MAAVLQVKFGEESDLIDFPRMSRILGPELAAALRAAADQVVPPNYASFTGHIEWDQGMEARSDSIREAILSIAAELEAHQ